MLMMMMMMMMMIMMMIIIMIIILVLLVCKILVFVTEKVDGKQVAGKTLMSERAFVTFQHTI